MVPTKVIIIGGGFGGLNAAKVLARESLVYTTLLDRHNYHLFQPLLYQVATAGLSPAEIAVPIRAIFSGMANVDVHMETVTAIDLKNRIITSDSETLSYDFLIVACGASHSYFGHEEWENSAPGLKTLEQATEIRRRILLAFERAEYEADPEKQKAFLTFVVVGGGPTGVELAGSIAEISRYTLGKDFRHINPSQARVLLVEAGPRILPAFSPDLSEQAVKDLRSLGVETWANSRVTQVKEGEVRLGEKLVKAATILWAAGVKPSSLSLALGTPLDTAGRVVVERDLSLPGHPECFVIGDQAHFADRKGKTLPGLAQVAVQQGRHAAANILRTIQGKSRLDFRYSDRGQMAAIGRKRAILQIGRLHGSGFFAWLAWLFVHIYYLIGFKNRIEVFFNWAWSYFTLKRGARLILDKDWRSGQRF